MIIHPITGKEVQLYPTEEYNAEISAHYDSECTHESAKTKVRFLTAKNGAVHYKSQCLVCGESAGQSILKAKVKNIDAVKPFDNNLRKAYTEERKAQIDAINLKHLKIQSDESRKFSKEYNEYIKSEEWKKISRNVIKRANGICEGCGEAKATQAHHLTYEHIFDELLFELVALCGECHSRIHTKEEDEEGQFEDEIICRSCRFIDFRDTKKGEIEWCGVHDQASRTALMPGGLCGPEHKSHEPLK